MPNFNMLLLIFLIPLILVYVAYTLEPYHQSSWRLIALVFGAGALTRVLLLVPQTVLHLPFATEQSSNFFVITVAPVIEQCLKLFVLWLILRQLKVNPIQGLVYGLMLGSGFSLVENLMFKFTPLGHIALQQAGSKMADVALFEITRIALTNVMQATMTGALGLAYGWAQTKERPQRQLYLVAGVVVVSLMSITGTLLALNGQPQNVFVLFHFAGFVLLTAAVWWFWYRHQSFKIDLVWQLTIVILLAGAFPMSLIGYVALTNFAASPQQTVSTIFAIVTIGVFGLQAIATTTARYLIKPIQDLTAAARLIEKGELDTAALESLGQRFIIDEITTLSQVFKQMAQQVHLREKQLKAEIVELQIQINEEKKRQDVQEIVESDYFKDLKANAANMRQRYRGPKRE